MKTAAGQLTREEINARLAAAKAAHRARFGEPRPIDWGELNATFGGGEDPFEQLMAMRHERREAAARKADKE